MQVGIGQVNAINRHRPAISLLCLLGSLSVVVFLLCFYNSIHMAGLRCAGLALGTNFLTNLTLRSF